LADLTPPLRQATVEDAPVLAELINQASEGLAHYAWTLMAAEGQDPWALGLERQAARASSWVVVDEGQGAVAALRAVPPEAAGEADPGMPPVFRPLVELEALAPDALYVNVLATLPQARGRGFGTMLLHHAERMARDAGRPRLSLIVADSNAGARRLYGRVGYREVAARPLVKAGWTGPGGEWLLMVTDLG
jgi:ribosomal protein S18 acetylase RimI-like enzyme